MKKVKRCIAAMLLSMLMCSASVWAGPIVSLEVSGGAPTGAFWVDNPDTNPNRQASGGGTWMARITNAVVDGWETFFRVYCIDPYHTLANNTTKLFEMLGLDEFLAQRGTASLEDEALSAIAGFDALNDAERQAWLWDIGLTTNPDYGFDPSTGEIVVVQRDGTPIRTPAGDPATVEAVIFRSVEDPLTQSVAAWRIVPGSAVPVGPGLFPLGFVMLVFMTHLWRRRSSKMGHVAFAA